MINEIPVIEIGSNSEPDSKPLNEVVATLNQQKIERQSTPESKVSDVPPPVTLNDIEAIVAQSVSKLMDTQKQQVEELEKKYQQELEATRSQNQLALANAQKEAEELKVRLAVQKEVSERFEALHKLAGSAIPLAEKPTSMMVNTRFPLNSDSPEGFLKECFHEIENARRVKSVQKSFEIVNVDVCDFNQQNLEREIRNNRREFELSVEDYCIRNGIVIESRYVQNNTNIAAISELFLTTLSAMERKVTIPGVVGPQFFETVTDFGASKGNNILIPRFNYSDSSDDYTDYMVSDGSSYSDLTSQSDGLSSSSVPFELKEYARGKNGTSVKPLLVSTFVSFTSTRDLMGWINRNLTHDYYTFLDNWFFSLLDTTTSVVYNDKGVLTDDPLDLNTGDDGTFTEAFAEALYEYAFVNNFCPYMDGSYTLILSPYAATQYKRSLKDDWEAPTVEDLQNFLTIFNPSWMPPEDTGLVSGFLGKWGPFNMFESKHKVVKLGQTETTGAGDKTTYTSFLMGRGCFGLGIGSPYQIRVEDYTNFGRRNRITWTALLSGGAIDHDPDAWNNPSQERRALKIRTLKTAI